MNIRTTILSLFLPLLAASCGQSEEQYGQIRSFVVVNNQEHNDATLASAMNNMSPGVFCLVQQTMRNGAPYFSFKNNQGSQSVSIFNGKDSRAAFTIGLNNGVIVGFGNMDSPAVFYAYDNQCPNCFDYQALPRKSYPLTMSVSGIAACANCHREYNMNTGGNMVKGEQGAANNLTRYRASTTGPYGMLSVN